jgi:hypothetical protein
LREFKLTQTQKHSQPDIDRPEPASGGASTDAYQVQPKTIYSSKTNKSTQQIAYIQIGDMLFGLPRPER